MSNAVPSRCARGETLLTNAIDQLLKFVANCEKNGHGIRRSKYDRFLELDREVAVHAQQIGLLPSLPQIEKLRRLLDVKSFDQPCQFIGATNLPGDWEDGVFLIFLNGNPWLEEMHTIRALAARRGWSQAANTLSTGLTDTLASAAEPVAEPQDSVPESKPPTGDDRQPSNTMTPKKYLQSWREILDALGMDNNTTEQRRVREANERYSGPIIMPAQGGQPKVVQLELIAWWNGLEDRYRADAAERDAALSDSAATVAQQYEQGRGEHSEIVVPDIEGHVKRRRGGSA